jgi:hypothetical protein
MDVFYFESFGTAAMQQNRQLPASLSEWKVKEIGNQTIN